jgi:hypothetical protein
MPTIARSLIPLRGRPSEALRRRFGIARFVPMRSTGAVAGRGVGASTRGGGRGVYNDDCARIHRCDAVSLLPVHDGGAIGMQQRLGRQRRQRKRARTTDGGGSRDAWRRMGSEASLDVKASPLHLVAYPDLVARRADDAPPSFLGSRSRVVLTVHIQQPTLVPGAGEREKRAGGHQLFRRGELGRRRGWRRGETRQKGC